MSLGLEPTTSVQPLPSPSEILGDAGQLLLGRVRALAPMVAPRAEEIATERRIPLDIVEAMREAGVYRAYVPRAFGGLQLQPAEVFRVVAALSRIDGSLGWTALLGTSIQMFVTLLPPEGYEALYRAGPDMMAAGSDQPSGKVEQVGDRYRLEGRWPFASGCLHSDWIGAMARVPDQPGSGADGEAPKLRIFFLPARCWTIEDTWRVIGLEGTGSHHISLPPTMVEPWMSFDASGTPPSPRPEPAFQNMHRWLPLAHAACQIGMAKGALDDVLVKLEQGHARREQGRTSQSEIAQNDLGRLLVTQRAVEATLEDVVGEQWRATVAGDADNPSLLVEADGVATWIAATCREIASGCFAMMGASAIGVDSSLGRRWRDIQVAGQHIKVNTKHYAALGRYRLSA